MKMSRLWNENFVYFFHRRKNYAHIWQSLDYMQLYWPRALRPAFSLSSGEEGYFRWKWRRGGLCTSTHFPVGLHRGPGFGWLGRKWGQLRRPRWGLRNTCALTLCIEPFWLRVECSSVNPYHGCLWWHCAAYTWTPLLPAPRALPLYFLSADLIYLKCLWSKK